jgi:hypothetical protein
MHAGDNYNLIGKDTIKSPVWEPLQKHASRLTVNDRKSFGVL